MGIVKDPKKKLLRHIWEYPEDDNEEDKLEYDIKQLTDLINTLYPTEKVITSKILIKTLRILQQGV